MNTGAGFLLILGGLLLLYTVVTGKFAVLESAFYQLFELTPPDQTPKATGPVDPTAGNTAAAGNVAVNAAGKVISLPQIFIDDYTHTGTNA